MYGHIQKLAEAEKKGIEEAGGSATLYQVPETLSDDVLAKMYAPPKPSNIETLSDPKTLEQYGTSITLFFPRNLATNQSLQHSVPSLSRIYYCLVFVCPILMLLAFRRLPLRHPHSLWQLPGPVESFLGSHWFAVADWCFLGQVCWSLREHRNPGRRSRADGFERHEHPDSPRHHLRASGIQDRVWNHGRPVGGQRRKSVGRRNFYVR